MAAITLATPPNAAAPFLVDKGGLQEPFLNGPVLRVNRLGLRLGAEFSIPPKRYGTDGRTIIADLIMATQNGIIVPYPQPDVDVGDEGTPKVKVAVSGGTTLQIKGLPADKPLSKGWFLSVKVASESNRRYLHPLAADATADVSGDCTLSLAIPIRTAFAVNDVVEIAAPMMQGHVIDERLSWQISVERIVAISFKVAEAA